MITELDHLVILVEELVETIASYEHRQFWDRYATSRRCRIRLKGPTQAEVRSLTGWRKGGRALVFGRRARPSFTDRGRNQAALACSRHCLPRTPTALLVS